MAAVALALAATTLLAVIAQFLFLRRVRNELAEQHAAAQATSTRLAARLTRLMETSRSTRRKVARVDSSLTALRNTVDPRPEPQPLDGADLTTPGRQVLGKLTFDGNAPAVVLLLHTFGESVMFAGLKTAVLAAAEVAGQLGRRLRVVVFEEAPGRSSVAEALSRLLREESRHPALAETLQVTTPTGPEVTGHHAEDVWVVTFWPTAWNLALLCREGLVRPERVVYLIQDWEPGFYPWGDLQLKALSTYSEGFQLLVNSASLARYVGDRTGRPVDRAAVFAPELHAPPLHAAAKLWQPSPGTLRVFFYARPSKPRNMFALGIQALRTWADSLPDDLDVVVRLAGEPIGPVDLGSRLRAEVRGKLSYDGYHELLADTDLGLALMSSPHPGHPSLELPMAGIPTVTNPFEGYRESWVDGLVVADGVDADALAAALSAAATLAQGAAAHSPAVIRPGLGSPVAQAVAAVVQRLGSSQA